VTEVSSPPPEDQSAFPFMGDVPVVGPRYRVGVIGATGAVGGTLLRVLRERAFPIGELRLFASPASRGKWLETPYGPLMIEQLVKRRVPELDVVFMAAGAEVARTWGRRLAYRGALVIDKSPYFRDKSYAPLVVPEINAETLTDQSRIVANPNCSTIPLVMALAPLHQRFGLRHVTVVTFQSVSGAGKRGITSLARELQDDEAEPTIFPQRIAYNVIPWIGSQVGAQCSEESKMIAETRRILDLPRLSIDVTCVRVPSLIGHALAVHARFGKHIPAALARQILMETPGIVVRDDPSKRLFPTPLDVSGKDDVFVGRIRRDRAQNSLALFVVADNLRKGAATNAVQIAEAMLGRGLIHSSM
jgi:aspartate-semialdehyde dehydrogenase